MEDAAASTLPNAPPEAPPDLFDVEELKGPQPFDVESLQSSAPASVPPLRAAMKPGQQFSPGVIARFRNGDAVTKAAQALAGDYATNFNAGVADDMQKFEDLGIKQGTLRTLGQALVHGAAFVKAGITAAFPAVLGGVQAGATEVLGKEGGQAVAQATAIAMTDASIQTMLMSGSQYSEATKVKRAPDGSYVDEHLGPVPDETAAAVQAQRIADYHGMPDAAETIKESYHQGVLPVEIHTDMSPEMTADLAAKEVPKAYPVSDWTGAAEPQAARAEETTPIPGSPTRPKPLTPIPGTGEEKVRGLSESIELAAKEDLGTLPTYKVSSNEVNLSNAEDFFTRDPEYAMQVAMGQRSPPPGIMPEAVLQRAVTRANESGDIEMQKSLANSGLTTAATTMGQRIQMLSNIDKDDPVVAMQQVQQARREALAAKGVDVAANENEVLKEYAPIRAQARAAKPNAWNAFINSIQCAE